MRRIIHPKRLPVVAAALAALLCLQHAATAQDQAGADAPPAWTAERMIEALAAEPEPMIRTRGLTVGEGTAAAATTATGAGVIHDLRIFFPFDSAELTPAARRTLDELAVALASPRLQGDRFRIAGHTDAVGDEAYNLDLSRRRAEAVVDYLARTHGISADRLIGEGYGESAPFDPANPTAGLNRRVEVVNLAAEGG